MIRFVFFDVANTLLHKPLLFQCICDCLRRFGHELPLRVVKFHHKLLTETIPFPVQTSKEFYTNFNAELLYSLGIIPDKKMLDAVYASCRDHKWAAFPDTSILAKIDQPIGIISNWDHRLHNILKEHFAHSFAKIVSSFELGISKPDPQIYLDAVTGLGADRSEIAYIGDSLKLDIEPALKLGMRSFLIDRDDFFSYYSGPKLSSLSQLDQYLGKSEST